MLNCCLQLRNSDSFISEEETPKKHNFSISDAHIYEQTTSGSTVHENDKCQSQHGNNLESRSHSGFYCSSYSETNRTNVDKIGMDSQSGGDLCKAENIACNGMAEYMCSESIAMKGSVKAKRPPYSLGTKNSKLPKSAMKESREQNCLERERKEQVEQETSQSKCLINHCFI